MREQKKRRATIKRMGAKTTEMLTKLYNKAFQEGEAPDDWQIGVIAPTHKKSDRSRCKGNNLDKHRAQSLRANNGQETKKDART